MIHCNTYFASVLTSLLSTSFILPSSNMMTYCLQCKKQTRMIQPFNIYNRTILKVLYNSFYIRLFLIHQRVLYSFVFVKSDTIYVSKNLKCMIQKTKGCNACIFCRFESIMLCEFPLRNFNHCIQIKHSDDVYMNFNKIYQI